MQKENELPLCRHIKANGDQCRSPRLRGHDFCYFHNRIRASHAATRLASPVHDFYNEKGDFVGHGVTPDPMPDLGPLEDRASIQIAISTVVNALANHAIDSKQAKALLYGLQLASSNAPQYYGHFSEPDAALDEVVLTSEGESIAPAEEGKKYIWQPA